MNSRLKIAFAFISYLFSLSLAQAQESAPSTHTVETLTLDSAIKIAQYALKQSHENGATNVAIVVVDFAARPLVMLRDDNATEHPLIAAERKAWTAANYRDSTKNVLSRIKKDDGDDGELVYTEKSLFLMGGVPIMNGKKIVGAIGVAGNPSGYQDDAVASKAAAYFKELANEK